ncbi:hypothetical protein M8C21_001831 [Ambrosia artemisiifolia]|uniref:Uncharacterized protein n=1 Tax=Ambrosia artemisiifolia TaxID=4212 RepID=A0AAD5CZG0_AMBAR|nr:hypothetical protein M8C21_001831 [Ambrosia artemisiifolia]
MNILLGRISVEGRSCQENELGRLALLHMRN